MDLRTNGGSLQSHKECDVPELGLTSWFNKNAVTNILSFAVKWPISFGSHTIIKAVTIYL
eukprot:scaffold417388_cov32-Attheya_sp.AAC.2